MRIAVAFLAFLLAGCASPVIPAPAPPITQTIHHRVEVTSIDATWEAFRVHGVPVTVPVRLVGQGSITTQWPATPHIIFAGELRVVPVQEFAAEAQQMVNDGRMLILRDGVPAALSPPETVPEER